MCGTGQCPKCGGDRLRRVVFLATLAEDGGHVQQKANAFICRRCGYVETYAILWDE